MDIWKFPADIAGSFVVEMPIGATVLAVQIQGDRPMLWATVDPFALNESRRFRWIGTGQSVPSDGDYIGTVQLMGGSLVYHLFEAA